MLAKRQSVVYSLSAANMTIVAIVFTSIKLVTDSRYCVSISAKLKLNLRSMARIELILITKMSTMT